MSRFDPGEDARLHRLHVGLGSQQFALRTPAEGDAVIEVADASDLAAWAAVRRLMSAPAYDQLARLFAEGRDYHPYFSTVHPVVWAGYTRMQPSEWQALCEWAAAWERTGGRFEWGAAPIAAPIAFWPDEEIEAAAEAADAADEPDMSDDDGHTDDEDHALPFGDELPY